MYIVTLQSLWDGLTSNWDVVILGMIIGFLIGQYQKLRNKYRDLTQESINEIIKINREKQVLQQRNKYLETICKSILNNKNDQSCKTSTE